MALIVRRGSDVEGACCCEPDGMGLGHQEVGALLGRDLAEETAKQMEYPWSVPSQDTQRRRASSALTRKSLLDGIHPFAESGRNRIEKLFAKT